MKSKRNMALLLGLTLTLTGLALAQSKPAAKTGRPSQWVNKLVYPKLKPLSIPEVTRETLPNGMQLMLVEDHELPKVEFRAVIRGGKLAEPANRNGLADLFGGTLRTGGTEKMGGDQMDEFLERIGASIESYAGEDDLTISGGALTEHVDQVLPLFADVILRPAFAQYKIELAQTQMRSEISRRNDQVQGIAQREFQKLIYGADSPYARQIEYDDVNRLTRADLVAFHGACFHPEATILAVWGDFNVSAMKQRLTDLFGGWPKGPGTIYPQPEMPAPAKSVNYIEKTDVEQTYILLGQRGLRYDDPDFPAIQVMSDILGGGFASRIFKRVRTEQGLAYGAGGTMIPAFDRPGSFYFYTSTKPASTSVALSSILDELERIRKEPVSDEELLYAKNSYLNGYVFWYDSKAEVVNRLMNYAFYGYPAEFAEKLRDGVEKVTKEDILRVAQKHLLPEKLSILAVGKGAEFDKPLSTFGEVHTIDIAIPEPKMAEEIPEPTPESLAKGTEALRKLAEAAGGAALTAIKDLTLEGKASMETPMGPMDVTIKGSMIMPNRLYQEITLAMGTMVMVVDGDTGWMKFGPRTMDLPGSQAAELKKAVLTECGCLYLLRQAQGGELQAQWLGKATFEGQDALQLVVRPMGKAIRMYLSADGTRLLGLRMMSQTQEGPAEVTTVYAGLQDVGGVKVPMESTQKQGDKVVGTSKYSSVTITARVDPAIFTKPAADGEPK